MVPILICGFVLSNFCFAIFFVPPNYITLFFGSMDSGVPKSTWVLLKPALYFTTAYHSLTSSFT
jgi:hypothetical protein